MKVDFHVHSTASDGTLEPETLVTEAVHLGITALALTDHDNCRGAEALLKADLPDGFNFFPGVELSIEPGSSFDKFHLLGLGIDPKCPELIALLENIRLKRNDRNRAISENFRQLGIDLPEDPLELLPQDQRTPTAIVARPHYAAWLLKHGYVATIAEAFDKYLLPDSLPATRCYEERWHPEQTAALAAIHAAGGLAIMAHPKYWRRDWKQQGCDYAAAARGLAEVKEKGLDGLECLYQANTLEENLEFTRIAHRLNLLKTAGSDFHGVHKPHIPLGMTVDDDFIAPVLQALSR